MQEAGSKQYLKRVDDCVRVAKAINESAAWIHRNHGFNYQVISRSCRKLNIKLKKATQGLKKYDYYKSEIARLDARVKEQEAQIQLLTKMLSMPYNNEYGQERKD